MHDRWNLEGDIPIGSRSFAQDTFLEEDLVFKCTNGWHWNFSESVFKYWYIHYFWFVGIVEGTWDKPGEGTDFLCNWSRWEQSGFSTILLNGADVSMVGYHSFKLKTCGYE